DALAEERRVRQEAALLQAAKHRHRRLERLAGDEPPCAEPHPVAADEATDPRAVGGSEDRGPKRSVQARHPRPRMDPSYAPGYNRQASVQRSAKGRCRRPRTRQGTLAARAT